MHITQADEVAHKSHLIESIGQSSHRRWLFLLLADFSVGLIAGMTRARYRLPRIATTTMFRSPEGTTQLSAERGEAQCWVSDPKRS